MKTGIIQGRLSPPVEGFQECPANWKREFRLLSELRLNHVEWIITSHSLRTNPIFYENVSEYPISSICADNLVDERIIDQQYLDANLKPLCEIALKNNIKNVTIPLLEDSSVIDDSVRKKFCKLIKKYSANYRELNFLFEAELEVTKLIEILSLSDNFFVTYDTGNITSCGFVHEEYLSSIWSRIRNVHLKDRTFDARTLSPTKGDTNFKQIFNFLREKGYNELYTLQTAREEFGDEVETIKRHKQILEKIYYNE